jgi:hypothetical protein
MSLVLKQGEAKRIKFTVKDGDGLVVDISATTLRFAVKKNRTDTAFVINIADADFDKTSAVVGIVYVDVSAAETAAMEGDYIGELKTTFTATNIDKSGDVLIEVAKAII